MIRDGLAGLCFCDFMKRHSRVHDSFGSYPFEPKRERWLLATVDTSTVAKFQSLLSHGLYRAGERDSTEHQASVSTEPRSIPRQSLGLYGALTEHQASVYTAPKSRSRRSHGLYRANVLFSIEPLSSMKPRSLRSHGLYRANVLFSTEPLQSIMPRSIPRHGLYRATV
jgi:hypothetical protein